MNKKILTLISRISEELSELDRILQRIEKAWASAETKMDELYLDSVALNLHGYYSSVERIFELIARNIDGSLPEGENWHQELLRQMMTEIKQVRPSIISRETYDSLNEYRGFRHVVRNVYTFNISSKKLRPLVEEMKNVHTSFKNEILKFIQLLENYNN
jgi:uncharacterized protein YutE (UPF0331/DUF86 family)